MFSQKPIRILGAISLDNEITREYVSTMKEFHRTFKPLPNHSIIQQQFAPHVYVHHTMPVITDTKPNTSLTNSPVTKNRKTRKIKK
jgi:hypothetical protein